MLAFLNRENVRALNLERIAFRMKDRGVLRGGHAAAAPSGTSTTRRCGRYGLLHADVPTARQFLLHADQLVAECGGPIDTPAADGRPGRPAPVRAPGVQAAGERPGALARQAAADRQRRVPRPVPPAPQDADLPASDLDDTDLLAIVYYLLLQDRIEEALDAFARVNPDKVATQMQYDYCAAYLELFKDEPKKARAIATRVPVPPGGPLAEHVRRGRRPARRDRGQGRQGRSTPTTATRTRASSPRPSRASR